MYLYVITDFLTSQKSCYMVAFLEAQVRANQSIIIIIIILITI